VDDGPGGLRSSDHRAVLDGPAARWLGWWTEQTHRVPATAAAQGFVLTTAQLEVSRSAARHAVAVRRWSVPARGVVCPLDLRDDDRHRRARREHAVRASAAALLHRDHVVSGRSGAILHGLPTLTVPRTAELTTPDGDGLGRSSVHRFGAGLSPERVTTWFGVPVTDVARTVVDLARHDPRDGLMALDGALRERLVTAGALDAVLADAVGWPGVRRAREVVALGSPLAESPLESVLRLALHRSGFPAPRLQVVISGYRVDLLLEECELVIEADGRGKYTGDQLWREKQREHVLRNAGYRVERVIWSDVLRGWAATERRLRDAVAVGSSPPGWSSTDVLQRPREWGRQEGQAAPSVLPGPAAVTEPSW
jgi:very-short-patch-repair endonuclease